MGQHQSCLEQQQGAAKKLLVHFDTAAYAVRGEAAAVEQGFHVSCLFAAFVSYRITVSFSALTVIRMVIIKIRRNQPVSYFPPLTY